ATSTTPPRKPATGEAVKGVSALGPHPRLDPPAAGELDLRAPIPQLVCHRQCRYDVPRRAAGGDQDAAWRLLAAVAALALHRLTSCGASPLRRRPTRCWRRSA